VSKSRSRISLKAKLATSVFVNLYLQACRQMRTVPVSSFICHLDKTDLNWNHYGVGPQGVKALAIALQSDTVITHLELEDNSLRAEGIRSLMEMLHQNTTIQSLNLSNNQLGYKGAEIISKFLSNNCFIKYIKLSGTSFQFFHLSIFFNVPLSGNCMVKELDLSHNKFCKRGGEHLGHMLETNVGIEKLNLSWSLHSVVDLCAGLELNWTLKRLYLKHNNFGHIQAKSLGKAVKLNSTLVLLDLSDNMIDDEAVTPLCQGLASNNTLIVIKLSYNPMTNPGAMTLLKTVVNNSESALKEVDISVSKFLEEQNLSIMDFCTALDKDGTMKVPTSVFRKAIKVSLTTSCTGCTILIHLLSENNKSVRENDLRMLQFYTCMNEQWRKRSCHVYRKQTYLWISVSVHIWSGSLTRRSQAP
uniref:Leucine rich repeat containing 74A n=1 Tax=Amphiprion percula TaxID=161767 RepID=A0A3P8RSR8_AMPPE